MNPVRPVSSHALATRSPRLLLLEMFSVAGRRHRATDCLNLCPKCAETRLRASVSSKNFPWVVPRTPRFKGKGRKAKGRVRWEGMRGREWEGKEDEGQEKEGREREGREDS
jgi:hypothetical protein